MAASAEVVQVACPLPSTGWAAQPARSTPLSRNATVPPAGTGDTCAVKRTGFPKTTGFADEARVVVVGVAACAMDGGTKEKKEKNRPKSVKKEVTRFIVRFSADGCRVWDNT